MFVVFAGCKDEKLGHMLKELFEAEYFRVTVVEDQDTVEVCGALKVSHTIEVTRLYGARCSSVVRAFAHGAMGRRIDPSWGGPIVLFLVPASAPRLV